MKLFTLMGCLFLFQGSDCGGLSRPQLSQSCRQLCALICSIREGSVGCMDNCSHRFWISEMSEEICQLHLKTLRIGQDPKL